jgi:polyisoprenoid-binding protein YceI
MSTSQTPLPSPAQQIRDGAAAGSWTLDPAASTVKVAVKHFWGLMTVRGAFASATGRADVNTDGAITASLEIDAASIDTKNKKRDQHLRSDDFFDVENHRRITFTTTDVALVDNTTIRVAGVVTAGGAEQTTTFDATLAGTADRATVAAEMVIDHHALGMTWSPLGMTKPTTLVTLALTYTRA